jgi:ketosteroid isomerase-like protein
MRRLLLLVSLLVVFVPAAPGLMTMGQASDTSTLDNSGDASADNVATVEALIAALEDEDLAAIVGRLAADAVLILPLSPDGDNATANIHRFEGREAVRSALWWNFLAYKRIVFEDEVITPSADGRVIFVEARGEFETLHGRPYRNVYLIKLVFNEAGAITWIEEWTNPVTASMTWGYPLGARTLPQVMVAGMVTGILTAVGVAGAVIIVARFAAGSRGPHP